MEFIQSIHNAKVKDWAKLLTKKGREKEEAYLVEGLHLVEEAIKQEAYIQALLVAEDYQQDDRVDSFFQKNPSRCFQVSEQVIHKLSDTETPQGILAVIRMKKWSLAPLLEGSRLLLLLDALQDPGNLGTMIRTADAAGIDGIILGKGTVDLYNSKVVRSTMGSIFHLPIVQDDLLLVCDTLTEHQFKIAATSLEGAISYDEASYTGSTAIVIGNEGNGVSREVLSRCHIKVKIPIYGQAESLNAAIAAAIMMYEAIRQRK